MKEEKISLAHGAGGSTMMKLIAEIVKQLSLRRAGSVGLDELDDGATIDLGDKTLVLTTDSHTVKPLFFPGGDIGRLAVCGTVNDLAVMGAKPMAMACAAVLPEGFPIEDLSRICRSMNEASLEADVPLITGDTKVVGGRDLDGVVITTTGIGSAETLVRDSGLRPGDEIISTGSVGDHGFTILAHREGINIGDGLRSDVAPLWETIDAALKAGEVHAMKDPTRGGVAGVLYDMASKAKVGILVDEASIPVSPAVRAASEMLGIDPLQVTNEGKAILGVAHEERDEILTAIRKTKYGKDAVVIGEATAQHPGQVVIETLVGGKRLLDLPVGDPAPRIC